MPASNSISFTASLPAYERAPLYLQGDGGWRLLLDVPDSETAALLQLLALRELPWRVTIEALGRSVIFEKVR